MTKKITPQSKNHNKNWKWLEEWTEKELGWSKWIDLKKQDYEKYKKSKITK